MCPNQTPYHHYSHNQNYVKSTMIHISKTKNNLLLIQHENKLIPQKTMRILGRHKWEDLKVWMGMQLTSFAFHFVWIKILYKSILLIISVFINHMKNQWTLFINCMQHKQNKTKHNCFQKQDLHVQISFFWKI